MEENTMAKVSKTGFQPSTSTGNEKQRKMNDKEPFDCPCSRTKPTYKRRNYIYAMQYKSEFGWSDAE